MSALPGYAVCFECAAIATYDVLTTELPEKCDRCERHYDVDSHTSDPRDAGALSRAVALSHQLMTNAMPAPPRPESPAVPNLIESSRLLTYVLEHYDGVPGDHTIGIRLVTLRTVRMTLRRLGYLS